MAMVMYEMNMPAVPKMNWRVLLGGCIAFLSLYRMYERRNL